MPPIPKYTKEEITLINNFLLYINLENKIKTIAVLGGGFISTRTPYNLSAGTVKYGDIYALLPFENDIVLCSIKGTYLLSKFINSTNRNYYIYSMIDASEVNSSETYYVITDSYSSDYKSNNLTVVKNLTLEYGVGYARDLFAQYLRDNYL